jgi:hypothetical protein
MTTSSTEERLARLQGSIEQIAPRLSTLEQDLRAGFDRMETRVETRFYWLLGTILAMWVTIILAVLLRS